MTESCTKFVGGKVWFLVVFEILVVLSGFLLL